MSPFFTESFVTEICYTRCTKSQSALKQTEGNPRLNRAKSGKTRILAKFYDNWI